MLKDLMQNIAASTAQIEGRRAESAAELATAAGQAGGAYGGGGPSKGNHGGRPVGNQGMPAGKLGAFLKSIAEQESGGDYGARGVQTSYGQALGKYQILDSNIAGPGGWDKEVLGRNISTRKFLNTPRLQERIARGKLTGYFNRYGAGGAAKAWYAGEGNARTNSDRPQYGGPSINDYAASVLRRMRKYR